MAGLRSLRLAAGACALALSGCGGAQIGTTVARTSPTAKAPAPHRPTAKESVIGRIDASSDRIIAEGKIHIAAGAPSDAEVKRELERARKAGVVIPSGETAQSFENGPSNEGGPAAFAQTPETHWNPRLKPIADWIVPILQWASEHGWSGSVTSGFRTFYEQAQLNAAGAFSAPAGLSNHETTRYPGGAVDVSQPGQLLGVLRAYPAAPKLVGGVLGAVDPEHFSATGY